MDALTFSAPAAVTLEISVGAADVRVREVPSSVGVHVTGEHDPDLVLVDAVTKPDGSLHVSVTERRRAVAVWRRGRSLDIAIDAPPQTTLVVGGGAIDVSNRGVLGSLRFDSGSGDARLDEISGDVTVKGASGDVRIGRVGGHLRVNLASGDVTVDTADRGATVRTASGDITLGSLRGDSSISSLSGDVEIGSAHPTALAVQAVSGDVEVGLAPGVSALLDISSLSGETRSDLDVSAAPGSDDAPPLDLKVNTVSGDVHIRRATKGLPE